MALKDAVDCFVEFINSVKTPNMRAVKITNTGKPPVEPKGFLDKKIKNPLDNTTGNITNEALLGAIRELLDQEMEVCTWIYEIEKFHAEEINVMGRVQTSIQQYSEGLTSK